MRLKPYIFAFLIACALLTGCAEEKGTFEKAGEKIDEKLEDAADSAEELKEEIKDEVDDQTDN